MKMLLKALFFTSVLKAVSGIVVKSVANTISYQQATASCQFDGKELCSAKEICSDGKTPYQGVIPGDHWVPARDSTNEWIQIGNKPHRPCVLHSRLGNKPSWGLTSSAHGFKGKLFCCNVKPEVKSVANTISYQQATASCQSDGKELCSAKEICSDGKTPYQGVIPGDHWVPARDSTNEWIQIGNKPHRPCVLHSHLGNKPSWGLTSSAHGFKGKLFCCKVKPEGIVVKSVANTISYQQATASCQFDGKELCSAKEICSDGKTPYQGVIPGDHWVPARDSTNEWIQIGNKPHRPCVLHSHLGNKPSWGLTSSAHGFKGKLFCCNVKPEDSRISINQRPNTLTYNGAKVYCSLKRESLCTATRICNSGLPFGGIKNGDQWTPVGDSPNEWLQIGHSPHKPCLLHSQLGAKPSWGTKPTPLAFKKYVFCCKP